MLRHYDKIGLLVPDHTDEWTGYRYYTLQQLSKLHRILALKDLGLSLQQIVDLIGEDDQLPPEQLRGMLTLKRAELTREKMEMELRLAQVEARLQRLEQEDEPSPYEIVTKPIDPLPVASVMELVPHLSEMGFYCESMTRQLYTRMQASEFEWRGPELILYHAEEYKETDVKVEACVGIHPKMLTTNDQAYSFQLHELPPHPLVAALVFEGPYAQLGPAIFDLLHWVASHNHRPIGPLREIHLSGAAHFDGDQENPITELQLPIEPL